MRRESVSIVWDKNGNFFQIWTFKFRGDGKAHAEKVAQKIGGAFLHIEEPNNDR